MKRLHLVTVVTMGLVGLTGVLVACSGDDTIVTSSADGGFDANAPETGATDAGVADVVTTDVAEPDPDAGFKPDAAQQQLAEVICETVARCCFGDATLDAGQAIDGGGTYNQAKCLDTYRNNGFEQSHPGPTADVNRLALSQTKSAECVQRMKSLSCELGFAEFQAARTACYGALVGTQPANAPCNVSGECAPGNFCTPDAGTCQAIRPVNSDCGDLSGDPLQAQHVCSNRFSGTPAAYCEYYDTVGDDVFPRNQWKCKSVRANGEYCLNNAWCGSGICNIADSKCASPVTYFPPSFCSGYK